MTVRKVAVTLSEDLYELVERARAIGHRSRSEVIQEALRAYFGDAVYRPSDDERRLLVEALEPIGQHPNTLREWAQVRSELWAPT